MKTQLVLSLITVAAIGVAVFTLIVPATPVPAEAETVAAPDLERGEYLVKMMGCNDCHTPMAMGPEGPEPDMTRQLSGHPEDFPIAAAPELGEGPWVWAGTGTLTAFAGPWGVSFAANLTPDPDTGIGNWTPEIFIRALRTGRHEGQGRPILPPMPYMWYAHATDDDLRAMFAYLMSIPAIPNRVPQPIDPAG
jgi:hypothetical protein